MSSFFKLIRPFLRFEWYTRVPMGAPACAWAPVPRAIALRTFDRHLTARINRCARDARSKIYGMDSSCGLALELGAQ